MPAQTLHRIVIWLVVAAAVQLLDVGTVSGATVAAASCSSSAVQSSIDAAQAGDTVVVPFGSCTWTNGVTIIGKGIHLTGNGATITNNAGTAHLITITEATSGRVRVSGLSFVGGTGTGFIIHVGSAVGGRAVLIDGNTFTGSLNAIDLNTTRALIWSNSINTAKVDRSFVHCKVNALGSTPYAAPSTIGTLDSTGESNVYVEDNVITTVPLQALDADDNCRIVIRHNIFDNSALSSHGADTSSIGARHYELYENTFIFTNFGDCDGSRTVNLPYLFFIRGGTGVIADNIIPDLNSCAWANKPELALTVMNLRRMGGPYPCWNAGWPAPHQIGQGSDGTNDILEPLYIWGNTGGGNYTSPSVQNYSPDQCGGGADVSQSLQPSRDYVVGAAKPGYAKYPYPHPLRLQIPAPPTSVRITR